MAARSAADIDTTLKPHGLLLRGGFLLETAHDAELLRVYPNARQLLLVGNAGSGIWPSLKAYIAEHPDDAHPLDQWSSGVLREVADTFEAVSLFPFGSPPWWPFQQWAKRAENVFQSPVAVLIHPTYGLWHAYRGVLLLPEPVELSPQLPQSSPCENCVEKPCLSACPVSAFTWQGYDVEGCADHVNSGNGLACRSRGCLARLACPVGAAWRYEADHAAFHMNAFRHAHMRVSIPV